MRATEPVNISGALRNLILWPFLAFAIGLAINSLAPFVALLLGSLVLLFARPRSSHSRWWAAGCLAVIGVASLLAAPPVIEEGMNAFVPGYPQDDALRQDLPAAFYDKGVELFGAAYPSDHRCNRPLVFRTRQVRFSRAYAFSSDGLWSGAKYSRHTTSVDFGNLADLRASFVNDAPYYWHPRCPDLVRTRMPFVVRYDLPESYCGSEVCWTGVVMLQDRQGLHDQSAGAPRCVTLAFEAGPPVVFGLGMIGSDLALKITPPTGLRAWAIGMEAGRIGVTLIVLLIFFRPRYVALALAMAGTIASLILVGRYEPDRHVYLYPFGNSVEVDTEPANASNFEVYRVLPADMDGFRHVAFARSILWNASQGDFREALRGGENVYVYMPGMRYLEAMTLAIFGDSEFGPIFFASLTVIGLFYLIATVVDATTALVLCAAFLLGPKLLTQPFLFDFDVWLHIYFGHWSDATATLALLTGSAILLRLADGRIVPSAGALLVPGILISIAVFLRANFAVVAMTVMVCGLWSLRQRQPPARLLVVAASFAFMATAALHNWVFSGELVPFTDTVQENLSAHPGDWVKALGGGDGARSTIAQQLRLWLGDFITDEWTRAEFIWLRLIALALLPALVLFKRLRTSANITLLAIILAAQLPLLFFLNTGRYGLIAWPCTLLGAVLVLRAAAVGAIDYSKRWRSTRAVPSR
jgi:hypothetical protein